MSPIAVAALVVVVVLAMFAVHGWRRSQANRAAQLVGGSATYPTPPGYPAGPAQAHSVGAPNPALPPPASVDHRVQTSGPPVQLTICGLPAIVWQRADYYLEHRQAMQLHARVDTGVGLPVLHLRHRSAIGRALHGAPVVVGVPALDERFEATGDVAAWAPVLARPDVQQALLAFPISTVDVYGGRLAFESLDGVHLDPGAVQAVAQIAATVLSAIPPQLTSAHPAAPITARIGATPGDPESVVRNVLAGTELTPEQQQAVLAMMRATEQRNAQGR